MGRSSNESSALPEENNFHNSNIALVIIVARFLASNTKKAKKIYSPSSSRFLFSSHLEI